MNNITHQTLIEKSIKNNMSLIGQDPDTIRETIETDLALTKEAIHKYQPSSKSRHYPCTAKIGFALCRGHVNVKITFGDNHSWEFESTFWGGGFSVTEGSGVSFWASDFIAPNDGEEMCFEITSATVTLGCIHIFFWKKGGPILGGLTIAAAGAGVIGGGGTGIWSRK